MYHSKADFVRAVTKIAQETSVGDNEDQSVKGQQLDEPPELLQPDDGPGEGPRGEEESMTSGAESEHQENREGGYLQNAFSGFDSVARQTGAELSNLLDSYGPKSVASRAPAEAGVSKIGEARLGAFADELCKITGQ